MKVFPLLVILLIISACTGELVHVTPKNIENETLLPVPVEPFRVTVQNGVKVVDMEVKQWEFLPAVVEVNEGDKVRLEIRSKDVIHGISIPFLGVNEKIEPGTVVKIDFIAEPPGVHEFKSSVYSGVGYKNMKGKIIINRKG
ncbi:hypothetical protein D6777_02100 [Candidatus Woesearchaeota archaeon]|nr:MAG: hypothetical protein D6777_02100 [Candidatus Woesearchaeota archaeon]